jgi:hypothetical protein
MRLSLEIASDGASAELYLDLEGRDLLVRRLMALNVDHEQFHLFSESWGDGELTEERRTPGNLIAHHLKVYLRPEGEALWSSDKA